MSTKKINELMGVVTIVSPFIAWLVTAKHLNIIRVTKPKIKGYFSAIPQTTEHWQLIVFPVLVLTAMITIWIYVASSNRSAFTGAKFDEFIRGVKVVYPKQLIKMTTEKTKQILVATIPMPTAVESLHTLITGATGTGKTIIIRMMVFCLLCRGDRGIFVDNNGELYSKFGTPRDKLISMYDRRTHGWVFYNEIRKDYDFVRYSKSVIPESSNSSQEEWNGYARMLFVDCAKRLHSMGDYTIHALHRLSTVEEVDVLKSFISGLPSESLFVEGAERALGSARFILGKYLDAHMAMPDGDFSFRSWLENENEGNLYIYWNEATKEQLKPLVSCWIDILCSSVLSLPEDRFRRLWMFIDELGSFEKIRALFDVLTKGRRSGFIFVGGIQSVSQLMDVYGEKAARILMSCMRNMVVLGGTRLDKETAAHMSAALGTHDVIRAKDSHTSGGQASSTSSSDDISRDEPVVTATELQTLPDRTAYVAFAGDYPITRVTFEYDDFVVHNDAFVE